MPNSQKQKNQWGAITHEFYQRIKGLRGNVKSDLWNIHIHKSNGYGYLAIAGWKNGTFWLNNEDGIYRDDLLQVLQNAPDVNSIEDIEKLKEYLITQSIRLDEREKIANGIR